MQTFPFRFSTGYSIAGLPFGVTPRTAAVVLTPGRLVVRFGIWRLSTALANVASTELGGPYTFLKTAGPAHLSLTDHGVTFATNGVRGLCVVFHEPVRGINPFGAPAHPNMTVTVAEPSGLAEAIEAVRPGV